LFADAVYVLGCCVSPDSLIHPDFFLYVLLTWRTPTRYAATFSPPCATTPARTAPPTPVVCATTPVMRCCSGSFGHAYLPAFIFARTLRVTLPHLPLLTPDSPLLQFCAFPTLRWHYAPVVTRCGILRSTATGVLPFSFQRCCLITVTFIERWHLFARALAAAAGAIYHHPGCGRLSLWRFPCQLLFTLLLSVCSLPGAILTVPVPSSPFAQFVNRF